MDDERPQWRELPEQSGRGHRLRRWAWVVSALVFVLVAGMGRIRIDLPEGVDFRFLPPVYSAINLLAAGCLVLALVFIRGGRVGRHRLAIRTAMLLSGLFLLLYMAYHLTSEPVRYGGDGPMRWVYYVLLATHVLLAALSLPFILLAYISGSTRDFSKHRKLVRWVYPVWLYVTLSGPLCYWMLRPYY